MFKLTKGLTLHLGDGRTITAIDDDCYVREIPPGAWIECQPVPHEPVIMTVSELWIDGVLVERTEPVTPPQT